MARAVNAAADVIHRAQMNGTRTATGLAIALESAQLLQSPETARELERLRARVAELEAARNASDESPRRRNRITRAHLEAVADVYNAAYAEGEPPSRAVADVFGTPYDTATKWVSRARRLDLIPPAAKSTVLREDPHDSPLHHDYRVGRDLPQTGSAQ